MIEKVLVHWPIRMHSMVCSNLSHAAFRRQLGGGMLERSGSHGSCVGRKVPEISRMECLVIMPFPYLTFMTLLIIFEDLDTSSQLTYFSGYWQLGMTNRAKTQ